MNSTYTYNCIININLTVALKYIYPLNNYVLWRLCFDAVLMSRGTGVVMERSQSLPSSKKQNSRLPVRIGMGTTKKASTPGCDDSDSAFKRKLFTIPMFSPLRRTLTLQLQSPKKEENGSEIITRSPQRSSFSVRSTSQNSPRRNNSYIKRSSSPSSSMLNSPRRSGPGSRSKTSSPPTASPFASRKKDMGSNLPTAATRCVSPRHNSCPTIAIKTENEKPTRPNFLPLKFMNSIDVTTPMSPSSDIMVSMDNIMSRTKSPLVSSTDGLSHSELIQRAKDKRKGGILLKSFSGDLSFAGSNKSLSGEMTSEYSSESFLTASSSSTHFQDGFAFINNNNNNNNNDNNNNNNNNESANSCYHTLGGTLVRNKSYSYPDKSDIVKEKKTSSNKSLSRGFSASCRFRSKTISSDRKSHSNVSTPAGAFHSNTLTPDCLYDDVFSSNDTLSSSSSLHLNTPVDEYKSCLNGTVNSSRGKTFKKSRVLTLPLQELDFTSPPDTNGHTPPRNVKFSRTLSESAAKRTYKTQPISPGEIADSKIPIPTSRKSYLQQFYGTPNVEPDMNNNLNKLKLGSHSHSLDSTPVHPFHHISSLSADNTPMASPDEPPTRTFSRRNRMFSFTSPKRKKIFSSSSSKKLPWDKESLTGYLTVHIHNAKGLHKNSDTYVVLETDSYGHFCKKAKTKQARGAEPLWDEKFHLEIEACNVLRLTTFNKLRLIGDDISGKVNIDLARENITDSKKHSLNVSLDKGIVKMNISVRYSSTYEEIKRFLSKCDFGVFGVPISVLCRREKSDIPKIVVTCIKEVEKRGMDEIGIYRLSGIASEIQHLKKLINNETEAGLVLLSDVDVHAVAGLLKLYFRELPHSLFTSKLYDKFVNGLNIETENKEEYMVDTLYELPRVNLMTALYLLNHLRKIVLLEATNKMGINNLATVFGPTLLRSPVSSSDKENEGEAWNLNSFDLGALDVVSQVGIFKYFLTLNDNERIKLPDEEEKAPPDEDYERWKRIDSERTVKVEMGETQEFLI